MCLFPETRLAASSIARQYAARRILRRHKLPRNPDANDAVRLLGLTVKNQYVKLASFTQSLWRLSYEEQLKYKSQRVRRRMEKLSAVVGEETFGNLEKPELVDIVPSPKVIEYRGKDQFYIHYGVDGNKATVGFPYGASRLLVAIPPVSLQNAITKSSHRTMAQLFQRFLRDPSTPSGMIASSYFDDGGYKRLTVRSSRSDNRLMLIVNFHGIGFDSEAIDRESRRMADYFLDVEFPELSNGRIASIYFQRTRLRGYEHAERAPYEHLGGEEYLDETLLDRRFRISPESFFQINVDCAEVLFRTVAEQCRLNRDETVLLDVGCGAGIYGIVLADHVRRSIGIDLNPSCVRDARENARRNGVTNAEFVCGRLETIAESDDERLRIDEDEKLVAVVNPGRWGLKADAVEALRRFDRLRTLIYVSCYPYESTFGNFVDLMRRETEKCTGDPFRLVKAVPIDMFPQTPHYELILLFER